MTAEEIQIFYRKLTELQTKGIEESIEKSDHSENAKLDPISIGTVQECSIAIIGALYTAVSIGPAWSGSDPDH